MDVYTINLTSLPRQHFLAGSGGQRNAVGAGGDLQRGQGGIGKDLIRDTSIPAPHGKNRPVIPGNMDDQIQILQKDCKGSMRSKETMGKNKNSI